MVVVMGLALPFILKILFLLYVRYRLTTDDLFQ